MPREFATGLSLDAWRILTQLGNDFVPTKKSGVKSADDQLAAMDLVLGRLSAFSGQMADGMTRDKGWLFLEIGRRLERVTDLSQLILHGFSRPDANENSRLLALLEIANSAMTYQSRYVFGPDPVRVLDLLIADESNPRSIAFQLSALYQHVRGLRVGQGSQIASEELNLIMTVFSDVRLLDVEAIVQVNRKGRRTRLISRLAQLIRGYERTFDLAHAYALDPRAGGPAVGRRERVIYHITHNTTYLYATAAEACHNVVRLDPRTTSGQTPARNGGARRTRAGPAAHVCRLFRQSGP